MASAVTLTVTNITDYFIVEDLEYYFAGSSGTWTSNNKGVHSSTAQTTLTARIGMSFSLTYSYSSESNYDKFYMTVAGTAVANGLSGATTSVNYSGTLTAGQTIVFKYTKDTSVNSNNDECTFSALTVTPTNAIVKQRLRRYNGTDYDNIYMASNMSSIIGGPLVIGNGGTGANNAPKAIYNIINPCSTLTNSTLATGDYLPLLDTSASTGKKVTLTNFITYMKTIM